MDKYRKWSDVPKNLMTKTQLKEAGLKPARDQGAAAQYVGGYGPYFLYDRDLAVPRRKPSEAQLAVLAKGRRKAMTTTCCNRFVNDINWRYKGDMCESCYQETRERRHEAFLKRERDEASEWARQVLADPATVILDTETTGLDGRIVEISIVGVDGAVLLDSLINPECSIPAGASAIHGITDQIVATAPAFAGIYPEIERVTRGKRVVIYNADFDIGRLEAEAQRCDLPTLDFYSECAMQEYARWYGEWSDYRRSFKWQRLHGGHRALGDCQATLERIKRMAENSHDDN